MHHTHQCYKQIWAYLRPMHTFYGNHDWGNHILNQKKKNIKPNVKINILDEGYALQVEGIA
jgi:hypothetical protein